MLPRREAMAEFDEEDIAQHCGEDAELKGIVILPANAVQLKSEKVEMTSCPAAWPAAAAKQTTALSRKESMVSTKKYICCAGRADRSAGEQWLVGSLRAWRASWDARGPVG